jgi:hypothetical protein
MPKGLKATSSPIAVSFDLQETLANTFTQSTVELALNALDNEVFVVLAVDLNVSPPDALAGIDTDVQGSISTTSKTTTVGLDDNNTIATAERTIRAAGFVDGGVGFSHMSGETPTAELDYIQIIATSNFFVQVQGNGNGGVKAMSGRLWGYRARADASAYAALVQSEVLSS